MKKSCLNCHFFSKEYREENTGRTLSFALRAKERESFEADPVGFDRGYESLKCYMGVWDEGVGPVAESEDKSLFSRDRGHDCFFIPYRQSMLFEAAMELQKRNETNRQLKTSYKYTIIGLWIAGMGLILNGLVALYKVIK
jgi:hypothetical protein